MCEWHCLVYVMHKNMYALLHLTGLKLTFGIKVVFGFKGTPLLLRVYLGS